MCSSSSATPVIAVFAKRRPWGRVPSLTSSSILKLYLQNHQSPLQSLCACAQLQVCRKGEQREKREKMGGQDKQRGKGVGRKATGRWKRGDRWGQGGFVKAGASPCRSLATRAQVFPHKGCPQQSLLSHKHWPM